ncbi:glycosyltransferase family 2 protein [Cohnella fermenti]|uniref:Glycosyltransferase family 2 protein n=1 Tax=Cohnella fermenti TaxID=2565925 RepID=A0A4S4C2R1_9BACL|nr:glycosyltransferase family 2 protein [Cohnella fermenti]THF79874.1 glycosyltransferase family 2 protein [Cohnella fermenti]
MLTVSLCIIVKNEETTLGRCLESVRDAVDEINIVDTGSSDRTVEIASRFTDRVFYYEWPDSFAKALNKAFSYATMDYILYMDADDVMLPKDRDAFLELKRTLDSSIDVVSMFYDYGTDEYGNVSLRYRYNRLVKRSRNFQWHGDCHQYLAASGKTLNADIAITHRRIKHATGRTLNLFRKKQQRGETFDARDYFYYGNELRENGHHAEAIEAYKTHLSRQDAWVDDKIYSCINSADCHRYLNDRGNELTMLLKSFEYGAPRAEAVSRIGDHFNHAGQFKTAIYWYELALRTRPAPDQWSFSYPAYYTWYPHLQLCVCYFKVGDLRTAYEHNEEARKYRPDDGSVKHNRKWLGERLGIKPESEPESES